MGNNNMDIIYGYDGLVWFINNPYSQDMVYA